MMSKLTEAMDALRPLADAGNWDGNTYTGDASVPALVSVAIDEMTQVDVMMEHIAEATSRPASPEERTQSALDMAAAQMRKLPPEQWPRWIVHLITDMDGATSEENYRAALQTVQNAIVQRLGATRP